MQSYEKYRLNRRTIKIPLPLHTNRHIVALGLLTPCRTLQRKLPDAPLPTYTFLLRHHLPSILLILMSWGSTTTITTIISTISGTAAASTIATTLGGQHLEMFLGAPPRIKCLD